MSEPSERRFPLSGPEGVAAEYFDLRAAAELSGMHPEMILEFHRARVVAVAGSDATGDPRFDLRGILRLRQIEALRHECQMSLRAIRLVMGLMDRLESAESELRQLRERVG